MSDINDKNNINKNEANKEEKNKKDSFFKQVLKSIKNFEQYEDFCIEGIDKTFKYLLKIVSIFMLVVTAMTVYKFSNYYNKALDNFNNEINMLSYQDEKLEINNNEKIEIEDKEILEGKLIIDTSDIEDAKINEYKENLKNENNGVVFLKDKVIIKNEITNSISETFYKDFFEQYNIQSLNKQEIIDYFNNNKFSIYISIFITLYLYMFIAYVASTILDALMLGLLGYLTAKIAGMKMKFSYTFSIGVHALTLPIILNIIIVILNGFTGFTVTYFQFMYTAISYIYVITAILMIKSDFIKRLAEVDKIKEVQEQVRMELAAKKQKEDDERAEEENKKEKEKQKQKEKKEEGTNSPEIGDKPQGSNV